MVGQEPPFVVDRLKLNLLRTLEGITVHGVVMPELRFLDVVIDPVAKRVRARVPRQASSVLAEEHIAAPAKREAPTPEPDVQPFVMAVRTLIESEQLAAARLLLEAAPTYIAGDPVVVRLRALLAPPVVKRVERRDVDRSQEYDWLRTEGHRYRGRWVALEGSRLLAATPTLRELREVLKTMPLPRAPLLHRID